MESSNRIPIQQATKVCFHASTASSLQRSGGSPAIKLSVANGSRDEPMGSAVAPCTPQWAPLDVTGDKVCKEQKQTTQQKLGDIDKRSRGELIRRGTWGNSPAKCHLDILLSHPTQLGQRMGCFVESNLDTSSSFQSKGFEKQNAKCLWGPRFGSVVTEPREWNRGRILNFRKHISNIIVEKLQFVLLEGANRTIVLMLSRTFSAKRFYRNVCRIKMLIYLQDLYNYFYFFYY